MATGKELKDTLWKAANKLRGSLSSSQYKDVILGLVFLKYFSDTHWKFLADNAKSPDINRLVDEAMQAVMAASPGLADLLPRLYHTVDQRRLGELVELLESARFGEPGTGARDLMGEVYEYFLGNFARTEGQRGGEFFTPPSVVRLIVEVLQPSSGRVYDPCCGSGGMFVQTEKFIAARDGDRTEIYGQESVEQTWRMAKMNLAVHGIDNTGLARGDTLVRDQHAGLQMDYVMANPPFNIKDWARDGQDPRWRFGVPPAGNANFGWIQHILSKLAPGGKAGVVMANGSMSSNTGGEGEIRERIVEADLVSCLVALPAQLFRSTGIPVCAWFFAMDKAQRSGQVLFVDARGLGRLVHRAERVLTDDEITRIGRAYNAWIGSKDVIYHDVPGFCRSVSMAEIRAADYVLTPGRYVGAPGGEDDGEAVGEKVARLTKDLLAALDESARLEQTVREQVEAAAVKVRLRDHLDFSSGTTPPPRESTGRFPVYGSNGAIGFAARYNASGPLIVLGRVGSYCGSLRYCDSDIWVTDNAMVCRAKDRAETRYWYYALQTCRLNEHRAGSGQPLLNQRILGDIAIPAVAAPQRSRVAALLGALDDKIAANDRVIAAAEGLMLATVESVTEYAPLSSLASRSARFADPLGFDDMVAHFSFPAFDEGAWPQAVGARSVRSGKFLLPAPCVLFSKLNPRIPRVWNVVALPTEMALASTEFVVLMPIGVDTSALWSALCVREVSETLQQLVAGTSGSRQRVRPRELLAAQVRDVRRLSADAARTITTLGELCHARRAESARLSDLRDAVLPLLMSGKVRVGPT